MITPQPGAALGVSRVLLKVLRVLNIGTGLLAIGMLAASYAVEPMFREFFTKQPPRIDSGLLVPALRLWILLALPALAALHVQLSRLLAIVETVGAGDPFVPENAVRLKTIAWCAVGLALFDLVCGVLAATMNAAGSHIEWSFSTTGWVAAALLFVLAQVFEQGTRIRADLEAMV
ncbi:MAG: DUF2975 domain-containing protein [Pseudomonadota bacterium]